MPDTLLAILQYVFARLPSATPEACVALCNEVCHQWRATGAAPDAGLVAKEPGQEHGIGADGQRYALDAVWVARPDRAADILIAAPVASQPWIGWYTPEQLPPAASYRAPYGARVLPVYGVGTPPTPPDPPPTDPDDLAAILAQLAAIEAALVRLDQEHDDLLAEVRAGGWPVRVTNGWLTLSGVVGPKR